MADVETSSAAVVANESATTASQRRSGRVVRPPTKYMADAVPTAKRKRSLGDGLAHSDDDADAAEEDLMSQNDEDDEAADDDDDEDEDEDEDDESGAKRRSWAQRKASAPPRSVKRAAKKPKLNGNHAANLPSRPKKTVRVAVTVEVDGDHGSELYADIFSSGDDSADVAARWYEKYQAGNQVAVTDLINCILSAAGCDHHVTEDDINDPDNCSNRLTELQEIYEDQKITEYPLIAKSRSSRSFRELLVQFFQSMINVLHDTEVLYKQPELMENVVRWVASLSSSTLRPFRHTATTVALSMLDGLVDVAKKLDERINKMTQQVETQKGRNGRAKGKDPRLTAFEASLREAGKNRERAAELMKEFFDTVFVHRYRDVDPRIRTECIEALGSWVWLLPAVYRQPEYLRYLGWMLSDGNPATRQEVLRQLGRVFKRDAGKMGHFIDRFRGRLIEMATKDADLGVRVTAIGVAEQLRPSGLLDPDEIDQVGRLIFDSEVRIRKAVVNYFADCVRDYASIKLDEVGGEETMLELFGKGQNRTGQLDTPRRDWIYVKSLADTMYGYEVQLGLGSKNAEHTYGLDAAAEVTGAVAPEISRLALATQVLVDKIPEVADWDILAGYLLYDHSVETKGRGRNKSKTTEMTFRAAVAPDEKQEALLLEILTAAAKATLASGVQGGRLRRRFDGGAHAGSSLSAPATAQAAADNNTEAAAMQLAALLPRLLRKFGAEPSTAVTVLRLEQSLDLTVFQQLRQDTSTFEVLLDEVCTQFTRHADMAVVSEAAAALLHARQQTELEEIADSRVSALWEANINSLRNFDKSCELSVRRNLKASLATELSVTLFKISKLASISDCTDAMEEEGTGAESTSPVIDILVKTIRRGKFEEVDEDLDNIEDGLTMHAMAACQFYFMWKMRSIMRSVEAKAEVPSTVIDRLAILKRDYSQNVIHTFSSRGYNDDLRLYAVGSYCDMHVLFASLRKHLNEPATMAKYVGLGRLIDQVPSALIKELVSVLDAAERSFAKKSKKALNEPAEDEDPAEDPLDDEDEDEDEDEQESAEERQAAELKAERSLCDLTSHYVMAIVARVLDSSGPQTGKLRRRLLRNQTKLGHSYKEIVAFLDEKKASEVMQANGRKKGETRGAAKGKEPLAGGLRLTTPGVEADTDGEAGALDTDMDMDAGDGSEDQGILIGAPTPAADLDDDELDDLLATPEPEEGTEEDLRRRELLDTALDEEDEEDDGDKGGNNDDDDSILGD